MAVQTLALFPVESAGVRLAQPIPAGLSRSKKRTAEKIQSIQMNRHPLLGLPLHVLAPRIVSASDRKYPGEVRCGNCAHLDSIQFYGTRKLFCELATTQRPARKWWPGCAQYKPIADPDE